MGGERRLVYGRRRGRPLRAGQRLLTSALLPQLSLQLPTAGGLDPRTAFAGPQQQIWLEIGFGGGEHLADQAERHPDIGFIGCEVFENGIARLLTLIERHRLANIRIFNDDARLLIAALPPASLVGVFILFPDPWPKRRHHKRRIVSSETLNGLARIMAGGAELRLATDDHNYLASMLELVCRHPAFEWTARCASDWRQRPSDWPATRYEAKARAAGRTPYFLRFRRRPIGGLSYL
jgi:tRNA (guanine-N7-)-methyltransferase